MHGIRAHRSGVATGMTTFIEKARIGLGVVICAALIMASGQPSARAQGLPDAVALGAELAAAADPGERLAAIEAALEAALAEQDPDVRLVFGLLQEQADIVRRMDDPVALADTLAWLAELAGRHRDVLAVDPAPYHAEARDLYAAGGRLADALREAGNALAADRAANRGADQIATTMARLADINEMAGRADVAAELRAQIAGLEETLRGDGTGNPEDGFSRVDVYYATDRARTGQTHPARFYGHGRGDLEHGVAEVTIPNIRRPGTIDTPSIWRLEFSANPARHVILQSVEPLPADGFYERIRDDLDGRDSDEAFVLVHGFNVSFEAATMRAAQMAHDMQFTGVPVVYSWPSRGATTGYIADTAVVRHSGRRLSQFLEAFVAQSGATRIHLVAHSMGNRALTDALELMALRIDAQDRPEPVFDQIVFAAPDVDAGLFASMIRTIRPLARRLTLYASDNDWALVVSRRLHGNAPRAGEGGELIIADPLIDSVDMSELGQDMLAHLYFADESSALVDLVTLFWQNLDPARRCGLEEMERTATVALWRYRAGACKDTTLLGVLAHLRAGIAISPDTARATIAELVGDDVVAAELTPVVQRLISR